MMVLRVWSIVCCGGKRWWGPISWGSNVVRRLRVVDSALREMHPQFVERSYPEVYHMRPFLAR